jgi:hypothetical protein
MKKNLLVLIFLAIGLNVYCQPAVKIFAFEQENLPGTIPSGVKDENGNPQKKAAAQKNYFIYLSFRKTYNITPVQLFIRRKALSVQTTHIRKTPVEYVSNTIPGSPEKTILVPKTANKVLEIKLGETSVPEKKNSYIQKLSKNDIVIAYLWNKKRYFIGLKKIKKLESVANE